MDDERAVVVALEVPGRAEDARLDENKTIAEVARDLDVTASVLGTWVKRARANRDGGKTGLMTEERAELAALRKEFRVVKMERDILGKAVAFFAKENA